MPFKSNTIFLDKETVSEKLRSARQGKKLKLFEVAKKLNISLKYLDALEKGQYEKLPPKSYAKTFLREYAIFLGLKYEDLAKIFDQELIYVKQPKSLKEIFIQHADKSTHFITIPKILINFIIVMVISSCFLYLGIRLKNINSSPDLIIVSPPGNLITDQREVEVIGEVDQETQVSINNESVLTQTGGKFTKTVNLKQGINLIVISAKKKYSKENIITRQILVK